MTSSNNSGQKPASFYDAILELLERGVKVCANRLESFALPKAVQKLPRLQTRMTVGNGGIALIKQFEGCARLRLDGLIEAYPDPGTGADPWTIGWGATGPGFGGKGRIEQGTVWTKAQCDARLKADLARYAAGVARVLGDAPTTQNQFDALVSFHYNTGAIARAMLTKKHIAGDFEGAAQEFARWNKAGGRVLKGLIRRRAAEAELYRSESCGSDLAKVD